jgi:hypothetical protein
MKTKEEKPTKPKKDKRRGERQPSEQGFANAMTSLEQQIVQHEQEFEGIAVQIQMVNACFQQMTDKLSRAEYSIAEIESDNARLRNDVERLRQVSQDQFVSYEQGLRDVWLQGEDSKGVCDGLTRQQSTMAALVRNVESENQALRREIERLKGLSDEQFTRQQQELRDSRSEVEHLKTLCQSTSEGVVPKIESANQVLRTEIGILRGLVDELFVSQDQARQELCSHGKGLEMVADECRRQHSMTNGLASRMESQSEILQNELARLRVFDERQFDSQTKRLGRLSLDVTELQMSFETLEEQQSALSFAIERAPFSRASHPGKSFSQVECPIKNPKSLDGIISFLTNGRPADVLENEAVTITAKSVSADESESGPSNCADLSGGSEFESKDAPGQWICWDFHERMISVSDYTIWTGCMKSWVVEGSVDGTEWRELDRRTEEKRLTPASFAVSTGSDSSQYRFIRLTQTEKNRYGSDILALNTVEFFGTLWNSK